MAAISVKPRLDFHLICVLSFLEQLSVLLVVDKVCSTKMMTNTDNVESSLLISIILNIRNLYK